MQTPLDLRLARAANEALRKARSSEAPTEDALVRFDPASMRELPDAVRARVVAACLEIALENVDDPSGRAFAAVCELLDLAPAPELAGAVERVERAIASVAAGAAFRALARIPVAWKERILAGEDDVRWRALRCLDVSQAFTRPARVDLTKLVAREPPLASLANVTLFGFGYTQQRADDVVAIAGAPFAAHLTAVHASGNPLGPDGVVALVTAPSYANVTWWVLQDVGLDDDALAAVAPVFARAGGAATALDLAKNRNVTVKGITSLLDALAGSDRLTSLNLSECSVGDAGARAIAERRPAQLAHLGLAKSGVSAATQADVRARLGKLTTCWF